MAWVSKQPVRKQYCLYGVAGLALQARNQKTGSVLQLLNTAQAGRTGAEWMIVCQTHGTTVEEKSFVIARRMHSDPAGWCPGCEKAMEERG